VNLCLPVQSNTRFSDDFGVGEAFLLIPFSADDSGGMYIFTKPARTWGEPAGSRSMTWDLFGAIKLYLLVLVYIYYNDED
jgi:hypothetical protein